MKLLKTISLVIATALATTLSAQAAIVQTDAWNAAGGAWNPANQPTYNAKNGGILNPDALSDNGADLYVSPFNIAAPPFFTNYGTGLYSDYFYTFFSLPTFTVSTSNVLDGVEKITFNLVSTALLSNPSVSLTYNGSLGADWFDSIVVGFDSNFNVDIVSYTWTWDIGSLPPESAFSLGWAAPSAHGVFYSVTLTQSVPEPSSLALITLGAAALYFKRRRSAV